MQSSNVYTINNDLPPSYAEATGASASNTHNLQFGQRYPHMVANTSPSVPPIQSVQQEYVLAERQSADIIVIRRTERSRTRERNRPEPYQRRIGRLYRVFCCCVKYIFVGIIIIIIVAVVLSQTI